MTGCTVRRYEQLETSPETIEHKFRLAVCERRQTGILKENYSRPIDIIGGWREGYFRVAAVELIGESIYDQKTLTPKKLIQTVF